MNNKKKIQYGVCNNFKNTVYKIAIKIKNT